MEKMMRISMKKRIRFCALMLSVFLLAALLFISGPAKAEEEQPQQAPEQITQTQEPEQNPEAEQPQEPEEESKPETDPEPEEPDPDFTGFKKIDGKKYYYKNGVCDTSYTGIVKHTRRTWYYLKEGALDKTFYGLSQVYGAGSWYLVKNGKVRWSFSGIADCNDQKFYIKRGTWITKASGYIQLEDGIYVFKQGKVNTSLNGWQTKDGGQIYLVNGKVSTGWKRIGGSRYYFRPADGKMVTQTVKINGRLEVFHTDGRWISTASMDKKANKAGSQTEYLILVDINKRVTKIYRGWKGNWQVVKNILCTVGDPTKGWDTVTGTFYVGYSSWGNPITRGPSFVDSEDHTLYYWTRFCDDFLFHSQLYYLDSKILAQENNELGQALSHGCVRMTIKNAKWIYKNIPDGTKVIVY